MLAVLTTQVVMIAQLCATVLPITSGYRTPEHNAFIGGAPESLHTQGRALDVAIVHLDYRTRGCVLKHSREIFKRVIVYETHMHVDHGREYD